MQKLLCFLIIAIVKAQEDYYKLLGVSRDCDDKTLRKQFKKLSLKYHPDKNKGNAEKNKEHFAKIVNAYEVLKDPKTREVYNKRGKKGVEEHIQNPNAGDQWGGFGDFSNFGHGNGAHFDFDQFFENNYQQQKQQIKPLFENSDVFEIQMKTISSFFRRKEVWLILFYKADEKSSKSKKDIWNSLAEKYYGIFKVAAINCLEEEEMCEEEFQVSSYPQIFAYQSNIDYDAIRFVDDFTEQNLANFGVRYMESFVQYVTQENYKDFVKKDLYKVLLFTERKTTPPLFKALSKDFKDKLIFGEVRQATSSLIKNFNISKMPTLIVITDSENYKSEVYQGEYKKDQIQKFLREYQNKKEETKVKIIFDINQACKDQNLCFILGTQQTQQNFTSMNRIQSQYPFIQMYILESKQEFSVLVKGKKQRYSFQYQNDEESIKEFIDDSISGGRQFQKMMENWPIQLRIQKLPENEEQDATSDL